jgi:hypothetical protein
MKKKATPRKQTTARKPKAQAAAGSPRGANRQHSAETLLQLIVSDDRGALARKTGITKM